MGFDGKQRNADLQKQCAGNDLPVRRYMFTRSSTWGVSFPARFFLHDPGRRKRPADPLAPLMR